MVKVTYKHKGGKLAGMISLPHKQTRGKFKDKFIVSPSRFEKDYIGVNTLQECLPYLERGFGIRMSVPRSGVGSSLFFGYLIEK